MSRLPPGTPLRSIEAQDAAWNLSTLLPFPLESNQPGPMAARRAPSAAANIINGMRSQRIGRALGIGIRVAGRIAAQRLAGQSQPRAGAMQAGSANATLSVGGGTTASAAQARTMGHAAGQAATRAGGGLARGLGGFFRPFRRVGGIVWLEVTGVLFLLPAFVFAPNLWREGVAYAHTDDHRTFWITAFVVAVFLYLGISSFWRARRR